MSYCRYQEESKKYVRGSYLQLSLLYDQIEFNFLGFIAYWNDRCQEWHPSLSLIGNRKEAIKWCFTQG